MRQEGPQEQNKGMRLFIEINVFMFLASAAMLFYVIKYRIHLHVEYAKRSGRGGRKARQEQSARRSGQQGVASADSPLEKDLISALENLGASKEEARARAAEAVAQGPGDFDALILRAMQAGSTSPFPRRSSRKNARQ